MSKKRSIGMIVILLIISGVFIGLKHWFPDYELFEYNLMEILTTIVVTVGIYFLTKTNDDIRSKNKKVEDIIDWLKNRFNNVFGEPIEQKRQAEYLHTFKYIDNKISVLEKLTKHLKCEADLREIKNEKQKLDDFVNENIGQGDQYFLGEKVKEKVPNILCNIETHLDNIMLQIYDIK